jgi:hypothetical protein
MRLALSLMFTATLLSAQSSFAASPQSTPIPPQTTSTPASIVIPPGTPITMELTRPVWAATVKPGDFFYAETIVSAIVGNHVVIPPGTYIEGTIKSFTKPTRQSNQALFHLRFEKIIFPNGYTLVLSKLAPRALVTVKVSTANDLLLDNGAQLTMSLRSPLILNTPQVAQAIALAQQPDLKQFKPATLCRTIPGSSGTADTVIPGTPGTPATVIPGIDGSPGTVIPGTPGTPPTTFFGTGSPATDPIYCPIPPSVVSSVPDTSSAQSALASVKTGRK